MTTSSEAPKGVAEEYKYLNDLTLLRINTTHKVWFEALVAVAAILGLSIRLKSAFLAFTSPALMAPFLLSMAYQLESITRIQTYISVAIDGRLDIGYGKPWFSSQKSDQSPWILQTTGVPYILASPAAIYLVGSFLIGAQYSTVECDALTHKEDWFPSLIDCLLSIHKRVIGWWLPSSLICLWAAAVLIRSYGKSSARRYASQWKNELDARSRELIRASLRLPLRADIVVPGAAALPGSTLLRRKLIFIVAVIAAGLVGFFASNRIERSAAEKRMEARAYGAAKQIAKVYADSVDNPQCRAAHTNWDEAEFDGIIAAARLALGVESVGRNTTGKLVDGAEAVNRNVTDLRERISRSNTPTTVAAYDLGYGLNYLLARLKQARAGHEDDAFLDQTYPSLRDPINDAIKVLGFPFALLPVKADDMMVAETALLMLQASCDGRFGSIPH